MLGVNERRTPTSQHRTDPSEPKWGFGLSYCEHVVRAWALLIVALWPMLGVAQNDIETEAAKKVRIGVLAYRDQWATLARWQPTAAYLSQQVPGYHFEMVTYDHVGLRSALARSELDFVLTNAGHFVEMREPFDLEALATQINDYRGHAMNHFGAVIISRSDRADLQSLEDLRTRSFAAAAKESFGGFDMAWAMLRERGVDPFKDFSSLHWTGLPQDQVVLMVRDGLVDAGTVRTGVLERMADEGTITLSDLKVIEPRADGDFPLLHTTKLYPEWPFARASHVSVAFGRVVAAALQSMPAEIEAARQAHVVGWSAPVDYTPVEKLLQSLPLSNSREQSAPRATAGKIVIGLAAILSIVVLLLLVLRARKQTY